MFNDFSLWDAIKSGGPVVYFLILCSIVSLGIILERFLYYYKRSRVPRTAFMQLIREQLAKNDIKKAITICKEIPTPFAAVAAAGLNSAHLDDKEVTSAMEREIITEINNLERRTAIIGTMGSTAVYIGLLGTVGGIIKSFRDIAQAGSGGINVVIHGISEALVCTAAGLFVAIPAVMAYNYFMRTVKKFVVDMELCASETEGLIKRAKKRSELNETA